MIGIPLGLIFANAVEWFAHKHALHGRGRRRESFFSFHFHDHHQAARRNGMIDPRYQAGVGLSWDPRTKEIASIVVLELFFLPLAPVAPFFVGTLVYSAFDYYRKHQRSHQDPAWAREHLPWHYDHHMGPNQDSNWCVTRPWFDHLMGTREPYAGTEREARDLLRSRERELARSARESAPVAGTAPATATATAAVAPAA
ncbi:hypothetical protein HY251_09730 [bacterium]|nr:hypothetical protein [bacterium]